MRKIVHLVQSTSATNELKLLFVQLRGERKRSSKSAVRWLMNLSLCGLNVLKVKKRECREIVCVRTTDKGGERRGKSKYRKKKDMSIPLSGKNARRMSLNKVKCCVEGCEKKLFCSNFWK